MFILTILFSLLARAENHFDVDSTKPNTLLRLRLAKLCTEIEPGASIIVEGHTDTRGSELYNLKLSKQRAEVVKKLIFRCAAGIVEDIKTVGMGESFPISENHDENRRVVVHLIQSKPKTIVITENKVTEINTVERHNWHVTGFVSNGNYDLSVSKTSTSASAELQRSWSAGVLVERRVYDSWYLGGGLTFDRQIMFGVGKGF